MANFLTYYKKHNPNLYSLLVSLLLAIWYNGITGLLNYYWPVRGPNISIVFLLLPIIVFLTDDGHLDELYQPPGIQYPIKGKQNQPDQIIRRQQNGAPVIVSSIVSPNVSPNASSSAIKNEKFN
jgi:hypothetical protein